MRINTNTSALNSHRLLNKSKVKSDKAMEKLSSGLRINRAGDDAAGLSISEKMKAQIRGLKQGERNIEDGISLIQTAEGGIAEIQSMVQRQRELCVQAANDTFTDEDREKIQQEINALNNAIDEIANNTHFNNVQLLNVDDTGETVVIGSGNALSLNVNNSGQLALRTDDGYSDATEDDNQTLIYGTGGTSTPKVMIAGVERNLYSFTTTPTVLNGDTYETVFTVDGIQITQYAKIVGTDSNMYEFKYDITNTSGGDKSVGFLFHMDTMLGSDDTAPFRVNGSSITNQVLYTGAGIPSEFVVYNHTTNQYLEARGIIDGSFDGINIIESPDKFGIGTYSSVCNWNFTPGGSLGDSGYGVWWDAETLSSGSTRTVNTFYGLKKPDFTSSVTYDGVLIQTGANEGQNFLITRKKITTSAIGTNGIDVTTSTGARTSITKADKALGTLSSERAKYGSFQNTLERTHSYVSNTGENLSASESRIADADMAKEMMDMTKNNILNQVAQSMLVQANSLPNSILTLLR